MAVDFALFLSPDGIALAHRQSEGHWAFLGETSLDVGDLGRRLATLRDAGEARAGRDFATLLILPDDQILYTTLQLDPQGGDMATAVGLGLDGRTPYALGELAFDYREEGAGRVQVAAVAQQTLTEAMDFARSAGFNGVGFGATPPEAKFPGMPIFEMQPGAGLGDLRSSGIPFGPDTWTGLPDVAAALPEEPAQVFVHEASAPPAPAVEPDAPADETDEDWAGEAASAQDDWRDSAAEDDAPDLDDLDFAFAEAVSEPASDATDAAGDTPEAQDETPDLAEEASAAPDARQTEPESDAQEDAAVEAPEETGATEGDGANAPEDAATDVAEDDAADAPQDTVADALETPGDPALAPDPVDPQTTAEIDADAADNAAEPGMAASMSTDDNQAASFLTDPSEKPAADEEAPQFASHRRQDTPPRMAPPLRRAARLDLTSSDDAAPETPRLTATLDVPPEAAAEDERPVETVAGDDAPVETAPEPRPEPDGAKLDPGAKTRKPRVARTPALFAGGGQPHAEAAPATLPEPVLARGPAVTPAAAASPPAAPSLVERLRSRRAEQQGPIEEDSTSYAFRRTPELPLGTRKVKLDDAVMTDGVLARRADPPARPSLRTALVLTVVLLLVLALIAVWSALFLPDSRVAQFFGRVAPQVDILEPAPEPEVEQGTALVAPADTPERPAPEAPVSDVAAPEIAALDPAPDPAPVAVVPARVPPPSLEEAEAEYAAYGIWQLAPNPPAEPARDFVIPEPGERIELAAIDPVDADQPQAALALLEPERAPLPQPSPPPFSAISTEAALVAATPEGVLTPDGAFVVAGQPALAATPRPGDITAPPTPDEGPEPAQTAAGGLTDAILAAFPPTPRPDGAVAAPDDSAGDTSEAGPRPVARPAALEELIQPEAPDDAIASSLLPQSRPQTVETAAAEAAERGPAGGASTASLAAPEPLEPPSVEPDIPSNASVSRSATVESAINLREINLIGVRGTAENRVALVRLASGRFVEVTVGDRLDGGRVAAIGTDTLQYVRNGRNITLEAPSG